MKNKFVSYVIVRRAFYYEMDFVFYFRRTLITVLSTRFWGAFFFPFRALDRVSLILSGLLNARWKVESYIGKLYVILHIFIIIKLKIFPYHITLTFSMHIILIITRTLLIIKRCVYRYSYDKIVFMC